MQTRYIWNAALTILVLSNLCFLHCQGASRKAIICLQPIQRGSCFGHAPSYAYNPFTRKCEEFIYGGCGGNDNRFKSKMECERNCRDV